MTDFSRSCWATPDELARIAAGERTSLGEALVAARPILLGLAALAVMALAVYLGRSLYLFGVGSTGPAHPIPTHVPETP